MWFILLVVCYVLILYFAYKPTPPIKVRMLFCKKLTLCFGSVSATANGCTSKWFWLPHFLLRVVSWVQVLFLPCALVLFDPKLHFLFQFLFALIEGFWLNWMLRLFLYFVCSLPLCCFVRHYDLERLGLSKGLVFLQGKSGETWLLQIKAAPHAFSLFHMCLFLPYNFLPWIGANLDLLWDSRRAPPPPGKVMMWMSCLWITGEYFFWEKSAHSIARVLSYSVSVIYRNDQGQIWWKAFENIWSWHC